MPKPKYSEFADSLDIDAIEEALGFEPLDHVGENDVGYCLFPDNHKHGDTTGKFAIHRGKHVYNCFACGGGSLLSLVMELHDSDVDEATDWLYQFTHGDKRSDGEFVDHFMAMLADTEQRVTTMPYFNERVLDKFDDDKSWFQTRGISKEIAEEYRLRFADVAMKAAPIRDHAEGKVKIDDDYYGPSAIFPHFWKGRLVGWQNRWMEWDRAHTKTPKWLAKYTNTTDFPKSYTLFNFDQALKAKQPVVVCESIPSVLMLASFEIPAVAFFGSKPTEPQLRLMRRFPGVLLAPDNDEQGLAFLRVTRKYLQNYIEVKELPLIKGEGSDVGDLVKEELRGNATLWGAINDYLNSAQDPTFIV